ncbi:MAG: hypothetical protein JRI68_13515 [Deltaproteobacteria bacterium]|nr:hypothetical protein [Deltaproteobacteria bacterium]
MTTRSSSTPLLRALAVVLACTGAATPLLGCGSDDTTAAGGAGGTAGNGGQGGTAGSTSTSGTGGQAGAPIHPGVLADDGLVARYYLDEAASGQAPTEVLDAAPDPLPLPLTYVNIGTDEFMTYTEDADGNRGLAFAAIGHDDRASIPVDSTKVSAALHASHAVTYEVVADVQGVSGSTSRIIHIGTDTEHTLSIETDAVTRLQFSVNEHGVGGIPVDLKTLGRAVFHTVLDTAQSEPADRVRIYVNGGRLPSVWGTPPDLDAPIDLGIGRDFVIGNREIGERSIEGVIYYAAVYGEPLTDEQILQNVALLLIDDDTPAGGAAD